MPINFHARENRYAYASRTADSSWSDVIPGLALPQGKIVLDVGCGGGIYTRAWKQSGAKQVIGMDFSEQMVEAAFEFSKGIEHMTFMAGNARADWQIDTARTHRCRAPGFDRLHGAPMPRRWRDHRKRSLDNLASSESILTFRIRFIRYYRK